MWRFILDLIPKMARQKMKAVFCITLCVMAVIKANLVEGAPGDRCPLLLASGVSDSDKTGCYIVNLLKETTPEKYQSVMSRVLQMTDDNKIYGSVQGVVKAFTVKLSSYSLESVSSSCSHSVHV